jgi:ribosome recycling factor
VIDEALFEAEEKMERAVSVAKEELSTVRTGRATPSMFSRIHVEYFGSPTPLNQMASINVPEARMAIVKPFDVSQLGAIERAIRDSDLGVNPGNDGTIIRVVFPDLTEERRREYIKTARSKAEDGRVSIRNVRRHAKDALDKLVKNGDTGEDEVRRAEAELDKTTGKYTAHVDEIVKAKEAELLEV